jgi:hypothetical protein
MKANNLLLTAATFFAMAIHLGPVMECTSKSRQRHFCFIKASNEPVNSVMITLNPLL